LGAAFYRTSVGVVDVVFMPQSKDFDVHVVEKRKDGRYLYSFEGKPRANVPVWDANRPYFFIQSHNAMITTDDETMAERLRTLGLPD
jgi:hypothetical protein